MIQTQESRPAVSRTAKVSWGDCNQSTARRRPVQLNAAPIMSTAAWEYWLIRRYLLETETPGLFGYFTAADGA